MNTKYLYTASGFVLPQMEEPRLLHDHIQYEWQQHLSSLHPIPVCGTHGFEVGKWYELDKDFFIAKTDLKLYGAPQPTKDNLGIDSGQKYDILPDGTLTPASPTFTLQDMIDAFESGVCLGWFHEGPEIKQGPPPPDMKQYFKTKFNIEL